MEEILQKILTEITDIKTEINEIKNEQRVMKKDIFAIQKSINKLEEQYESMDGRQKEMYLILKGLEEDRPFTKKALDRLEMDMDKLQKLFGQGKLPTGLYS